jgi:hypothetical protein
MLQPSSFYTVVLNNIPVFNVGHHVERGNVQFVQVHSTVQYSTCKSRTYLLTYSHIREAKSYYCLDYRLCIPEVKPIQNIKINRVNYALFHN